ncbi:MAG TPA: sn-glycerol-3-phosphate ABC transporter ATP-binding protein UgpC [Alphaproteobacteria bacterium]|nr:sn-glycerol-3-phosphate ABC transporter ATP-binding protein UgpC [Alphaproteobacteria bacterium]
MAFVRLENVCKRYDGSGELAVDNVSFEVSDGEFMVLLGPSGCGKSTTLRMIAGLESISEGRLTIDGVEMNRVPAKDRDIAMVFQSYALYPHMTVRDNLAFGLRRRNVAKAEVERRVTAVAETLGLSALVQRKPHALSGGQRQRVALGRAIVRDPKVFLFDEPLSNLDAALRVSTRSELIKLHQRLRGTMIYVTHDQVEAMTMGTRICIMNKGRVAQIGAPLEVYRNPADMFVAGFLGNPPMNLIATEFGGSAARPVVRVGGRDIALPFPIDAAGANGQRIVFGIRPEDIYEGAAPGLRHGAELSARVVATEPLGAETLVVIALEGTPKDVILRAGRDCQARPGERISVTLDLSAAHVFDAKTGRAISPATQASAQHTQQQVTV